mgnify:CR=1 FL=1
MINKSIRAKSLSTKAVVRLRVASVEMIATETLRRSYGQRGEIGAILSEYFCAFTRRPIYTPPQHILTFLLLYKMLIYGAAQYKFYGLILSPVTEGCFHAF